MRKERQRYLTKKSCRCESRWVYLEMKAHDRVGKEGDVGMRSWEPMDLGFSGMDDHHGVCGPAEG